MDGGLQHCGEGATGRPCDDPERALRMTNRAVLLTIDAMPGWIALSDQKEPPKPVADASLLDHGLFILEHLLPLDQPTVLLGHHADDGWPRTFSVFADPVAGLTILHRQGQDLRRHHLAGPLPRGQTKARISFGFDAPARQWRLSYEVLQSDTRCETQGANPLPLRMADLRALCAATSRTSRHNSVLWFGATQGTAPPSHAPWIGLRTPVDTPRGPVAAGQLEVGDLISTVDQGPMPIIGTKRMELPSRGTFAPVLLRAPHFAERRDILVSADQMVLISGASVEYLFGEEEVLAAASLLMDGRVAAQEERRSVTTCVALDLGEPALITADGCCLLSAPLGARAGQSRWPRRALLDFEALPLMALLGRTVTRLVA